MSEDIEKEKYEFVQKPFKGKHFFKLSTDSPGDITIDVSKLFDFAKPYDTFRVSLSAKRIFKRYNALIVDNNNRILNHSFTEQFVHIDTGDKIKRKYNEGLRDTEEFILNIISMKMDIDDGGELTKIPYPVFINELMNVVTDNIIKIIFNYVDSVYMGSMDELIDSTKHKHSMDMTFTDMDIKGMCHVKYAANLIVPICTHYCNIMIREVDSKEFFHDLAIALFKRMSLTLKYDNDILDKLHRYTTKIVKNSVKVHKKMYDNMAIKGITTDTEIENNFSKVLAKIIAVIEPVDKAASYLLGVIKNTSATWTPQTDNGYNHLNGFGDDYKNTGSDDNIVTEIEIHENKIARPDELLKIVRRYTADDTIGKISARYGVFIDSYEEYLFYMNNLYLHNMQSKTIFNIFSHSYGGIDNMYDNNRHNYVRLLILTINYLRKQGFNILADYVASNCVGHSFTQRWGGKNSDRKFYEDPRYTEIVDGKYRFIRGFFEKKDFIRDDVIHLANDKFVYNNFGDPRNGNIIKHSDEELINEILEFYLKIIN